MNILIFKDENEDLKLKENLVNLSFFDIVECETMTKKDILRMYQAYGEDLNIIITDFIKARIDLEISQLLNAINIKTTEFEFYSQFKAKQFGNLKIGECLRIEDMFKKSLTKEDRWNLVADNLLNSWKTCTVQGDLKIGGM